MRTQRWRRRELIQPWNVKMARREGQGRVYTRGWCESEITGAQSADVILNAARRRQGSDYRDGTKGRGTKGRGTCETQHEGGGIRRTMGSSGTDWECPM